MLIDKIHWLGHSSFKIKTEAGKTIYIDPFQLSPKAEKADIIFCTHEHHDHCSPKDIDLIAKTGTIIVGNAAVSAKLARPVQVVKPGDKGNVAGFAYEAVPAYNFKIPNHAVELGHTGFVITIDGERLYHAGDTDLIPEMKNISVDVALLPVGDTYTMDPAEAARAAEIIKLKIAVPMHYGSAVGKPEDGRKFVSLCKCARLLKQEI